MKRFLQATICTIIICCAAFAFAQNAQAAEMTVADTNVNFREEASLNSVVMKALDKGTKVEVLEHDPAGWSKVKFNGTTGYIRSDFLTVSTASGSVTFITTDTVNVRTEPNTGAYVFASVDLGNTVQVLEHNPAGWSKVSVNGSTGYIRSDFLAIPIQSANSQNTNQTTGASAQASLPSQTAQTPSTLVTADGVNFRSGPSTDTSIISTIRSGTRVAVLEYNPTGWSTVQVNNAIGYIRSDLLRPDSSKVELLDWSVVRTLMQRGKPIPVFDVRSGITYNISCFSIYDHADVEPITRADTNTIFNIRGGVWSWAARPVWVIIGDRVIAASIHGMPHDVSTIPDNGMNGHLCLHFLGSTTSSTSQSYKQDLQNAVQEAWNAVKDFN